ncbi:MAG: histidine kinase [Paraprevotella sp.]|nr:histidine kinase [Paraprevotella sp.]
MGKMRTNKFSRYSDIFFLLFFFPLVITLLPVDKWVEHRPWFSAAFLLYLFGLFVYYRRINMPRLLLKKEYLKCAGYLLVVVCTTSLFVYILSLLYDSNDVMKAIRNKQQIQAVWFLTIIVTAYCFSNHLLIELFRQSMYRRNLEDEKNKAELALFKAQINPHFLFNTLNTLYGLLITHSDKAEASFEKFVNLVKYMYRNANSDYIPISQEIDYIGQYVELQSLRLSEQTQVTFRHETESPQKPIPPMLLITFIENAFKYGVSSGENGFIHIELMQKGDLVHFYIENRILIREVKDSKKMGIENSRKRLELLYPDKHDLKITAENDIFRVELTLNIS